MGNTRGVQFADSEDEYGRTALPKEKESPGNPFLVEIEKFTSSTISPDKHNENISVENSSSKEGENDKRLKLDCKSLWLFLRKLFRQHHGTLFRGENRS